MSISRYQKNTGDLIYFPTIEACKAFNVNRLPAAYGDASDAPGQFTSDDTTYPENSPDATPDYLYGDSSATDLPLTGPQFGTFSGSPFADSFQNLTLPSVNTRDIVIEVLGNSPYTIKTQNTGGIITSVYTYSGQSSTPIYMISLAPTNPDGSPFELEISHEHEWGTQTDIFSTILRAGAQLVGGADDFIQKLKNIGNSATNGQGGFKQLPNRRYDLAETYSSTQKQHITIPFSLFTPGGTGLQGENFLRDILDPLTLITAISYPKRSQGFGNNLPSFLSGNVDLGNGNRIENGQAVDSSDQPIDANDPTIQDSINALNPGFRVFVADPPSYVNVYHQGGLFSYKNCYIKKFSYKWKNWVDGVGIPINDSSDPDSGPPGILQTIADNANLAYPVIAECSLEIATTEPLFSDDFIALSNLRENANNGSGGITSVTDGSSLHG